MPPSEHLLQTCYLHTLLASSPIAFSSTGLHFYFYFFSPTHLNYFRIITPVFTYAPSFGDLALKREVL